MAVSVSGQRVAVVGRALSLVDSGEGERIDAADVVVRINARLPLDAGTPEDRGERTDIVYHARRSKAEAKAAVRRGVPAQRVGSKFRRRLAWERPEYRPFTGTVAVFWALCGGASEVYATGMDLYLESSALGADGGELEWDNWHHDPQEDVRLLRRLMDHCDRFVPWPPLRARLEVYEA